MQEHERRDRHVSRKFPIARRRVELSWSHHQVVAALESPEQDAWLDRAEAGRWTTAELRGQVREPRRLGGIIREDWLRAVEKRERIEQAARALLQATSPADDRGLYRLVPVLAIERAQRGTRGARDVTLPGEPVLRLPSRAYVDEPEAAGCGWNHYGFRQTCRSCCPPTTRGCHETRLSVGADSATSRSTADGVSQVSPYSS